MQTWFDVIREGPFWTVRCQSSKIGRYRTQMDAFNAAVTEARKIKESGRLVHVRVIRDGEPRSGDFLSLL